jgi:hypothetical protein
VLGEAQEGCHTYFEMIKVDPTGVDFLKGKDIDTRQETALLPWSSGTTGPPKVTFDILVLNWFELKLPNFRE